ncbi:MAG: ArnT family glycosyltransferase, partial [Promethearchaeota archaeon]
LPSLIRYGPVSAYIYNFPNLFLPISELNYRLLNLIIILGCFVFSYKILRLFFSQSVSIFGTLSLFCTPIVFSYVYLEYLLIAFLFLQFASFYYLLLYLKTKRAGFLFISYFILFIAIFYKDPLILLIPLYAFVGLIYSFHQVKANQMNPSFFKVFQEFRLFFYLSIICILYYIPWYFLYNMYVWRSYIFTPEYLFNLDRILMYLNAIASWLGIIFLLAIVGLFIRCITKNLNYLDLITILWFVILYFFYTLDYWPLAEPRFIIPGLFFFYYNAGEFVYISIEKIRQTLPMLFTKTISPGVICSVLFIIVLFSLIIDSYQISQHEFDNDYLPFNEVSRYLKENIPTTSSILVTMGPNPYFFYFQKFELNMTFRTDLWKSPNDQNASNLYLFCQEENIQYVMFPNSEWSVNYNNPNLIEMIGNDERFLLLEQFQYRNSESFLYLFQLDFNGSTTEIGSCYSN